jgi:hypothetical protein
MKVFNRILITASSLVLISSTFTGAAFAASSAGGQPEIIREPGLSIVMFETRHGRIRCNLPADLSDGDTISGTIFVEPKGRSASERNRTETELNNYNIFVAGQECPVRLGEFSVKLVNSGPSVLVELKDKKDAQVSSTNLTAGASGSEPALPPGTVALQSVTQQNGPVRCRGSFDGEFKNSAVTIGGREAVKLAESPRSLVAMCPGELVGSANVEVREDDMVSQGTVSSLSISVEINSTKLAKGQSAVATVRVLGTDRLPSPVQVKLENRTPNVVTLDGGNTQYVEIQPGSPQFDLSRKVTALHTGVFQIEAKLMGALAGR